MQAKLYLNGDMMKIQEFVFKAKKQDKRNIFEKTTKDLIAYGEASKDLYYDYLVMINDFVRFLLRITAIYFYYTIF